VDCRLTDADAGIGTAIYTVVFKHDDGKLYSFESIDDGGIGPDQDRFPEEVECVEVEAYQQTSYRQVSDRPIKQKETA
jgi:hypothetical protein